MSEWINCTDKLPPNGRYVLVHHTRDNWLDSGDQDGVSYVVAKFVQGISKPERAAMKRGELPDPDTTGITHVGGQTRYSTRKRSSVTRCEDECGNNHRPYSWEPFGPGSFFGQEVDRWMEIPRRQRRRPL